MTRPVSEPPCTTSSFLREASAPTCHGDPSAHRLKAWGPPSADRNGSGVSEPISARDGNAGSEAWAEAGTETRLYPKGHQAHRMSEALQRSGPLYVTQQKASRDGAWVMSST